MNPLNDLLVFDMPWWFWVEQRAWKASQIHTPVCSNLSRCIHTDAFKYARSVYVRFLRCEIEVRNLKYRSNTYIGYNVFM